jgi:hypothetical protein
MASCIPHPGSLRPYIPGVAGMTVLPHSWSSYLMYSDTGIHADQNLKTITCWIIEGMHACHSYIQYYRRKSSLCLGLAIFIATRSLRTSTLSTSQDSGLLADFFVTCTHRNNFLRSRSLFCFSGSFRQAGASFGSITLSNASVNLQQVGSLPYALLEVTRSVGVFR